MKNIKRGWEKFCSHIGFEVGDGSKVRFWYDLWCGDIALKETFLVFFFACAKDSSVAAHMKYSGGTIQ